MYITGFSFLSQTFLHRISCFVYIRDALLGGGGGGRGGLSILYPKMTTESKGPRTKMLLVHVGAGDSSNQPKI